MWFYRRFKNLLTACCLVLLLLFLVHKFTNLFDIVFYLISQNSNDLPLSIHCNGGRLGNQMCTYATLYGLSTLNHRQRIITLSCNAKHLKGIFVGPPKSQSIHKLLYFRFHPWELKPFLQASDSSIPPNVNYLEGYKYPCSYTFFEHVKDEIRQEFKFEDPFVQYARDVLRKANVQGSRDATYVGVHVRRGDYDVWLAAFEGVPVNMEYFRRAIQYFRDKYASVVFVAVSEDRLWCIRNLASRFGVYVPEEAPSPAHDLALLASCNHTILSYGTFGFWGAYLAGGEVLYFDKFLKPNTTFVREKFVFEKMYPPYWRGIVTVNASQFFQEGKSV